VCVKALNEAQFELEHHQSMLLQSQQTWAGRFDRFDCVTLLSCVFMLSLMLCNKIEGARESAYLCQVNFYRIVT